MLYVNFFMIIIIYLHLLKLKNIMESILTIVFINLKTKKNNNW